MLVREAGEPEEAEEDACGELGIGKVWLCGADAGELTWKVSIVWRW